MLAKIIIDIALKILVIPSASNGFQKYTINAKKIEYAKRNQIESK